MRTDFNVFGYKTDDMLAVKTKRQMKKIFSEHGLKVAAGDVFHSDDEARVLAEKIGLSSYYQAKFWRGCFGYL